MFLSGFCLGVELIAITNVKKRVEDAGKLKQMLSWKPSECEGWGRVGERGNIVGQE